ncbi:MAG: hypothetical protein ABMA15_07285, partial [Vicinamibacterales bacterium]
MAPVSAVAAVVLGAALQVADGVLSPRALIFMAAALLLVTAGVVTRRSHSFRSLDTKILPPLCAVGLVLQVGQLYISAPGINLRMDAQFTAVFTAGIAALALVGAVIVSGPSRRSGLALGALVAIHFAVGVWVIWHVQGIFIDVDVFQRQSVDALRHGINPYSITFPNIYSDDRFYAPGTTINGRVQFGYPYFPLSLLAVLPGTLLSGDHRYTALIAMELAAVLMACSRPNGFGALAAVLYLTTPREFYMLEQSWTEPIVVLGLAAVVYAACRNQRMVPWLFGAFIALKQYLVLALPAALLLAQPRVDRRALIRLFGVAAAVAAAVTVPFLVWDPAAFLKSVVTLQFRQPFRTDSLSFLAWWTTSGHSQPSVTIAFGMAGVVS